mmetsp:Transcript_52481/g.60022  ORF Transcript_52481/g.60022 Transcript_52481/m.60022 type:complete len:283 (+) Transcript_52481:972-1820(+)
MHLRSSNIVRDQSEEFTCQSGQVTLLLALNNIRNLPENRVAIIDGIFAQRSQGSLFGIVADRLQCVSHGRLIEDKLDEIGNTHRNFSRFLSSGDINGPGAFSFVFVALSESDVLTSNSLVSPFLVETVNSSVDIVEGSPQLGTGGFTNSSPSIPTVVAGSSFFHQGLNEIVFIIIPGKIGLIQHSIIQLSFMMQHLTRSHLGTLIINLARNLIGNLFTIITPFTLTGTSTHRCRTSISLATWSFLCGGFLLGGDFLFLLLFFFFFDFFNHLSSLDTFATLVC